MLDGDALTLLDAVNTGVVACDAEGTVVIVNAVARALFGTGGTGVGAAEAAVFGTVFDVDGVTPLPADRLPLARAAREGTVTDLELVVVPPTGIARRIGATARPLRAPDGHLAGAVATLTDLTGLAETNRRLTRALAELESFAAVASHDLKNPLATVTGYVQLLAHLEPDQRGTAEYDEFVAGIEDAVHTARALIDDLLAYATTPQAPLHVAPLDLAALVHEVVETRTTFLRHRNAPDTGQPLITVGQLPPVMADATMLRQVLENLVDNALKYTVPGRPAVLHVEASQDVAGRVRIEVADEGIGIPAGEHDAVFRDFHRAHTAAGYPGTGLGLAICKRIIARHGGTIGARPNRGGGTRFWFTLAAPPAPGRTAESTAPIATPDSVGYRAGPT